MYPLKHSPVRANPDLLPRRYRLGMWAWILQRITGLGIVLFLLMHIWEISSVSRSGAAGFDQVMNALRNPLAAVGELVLFAAVLYHGVNGIRLILFDLGIGVRRQRALFWGVMVVSGTLLALGLSAFLRLIFGTAPALMPLH
ncbi:MAG: succinate dehydrogenase, cytochrome b556 subunit [Bacillota bacterium]